MQADDVLLMEMQRQAERLFDHQASAMEELDDKSEQMISVTLGALGGAFAIASFLMRPHDPAVEWFPLAWMGVATLVALLAGVAFLGAYVGFRTNNFLKVGPDASWLAARSQEPGWDLRTHLTHVLAAYAVFEAENERVMARVARSRRWGLALLAASVVGFTGLYVYLLARGV